MSATIKSVLGEIQAQLASLAERLERVEARLAGRRPPAIQAPVGAS